MHADLSQEIQGKIAGGVEANQRAIDAWVEEYNHVRPHESIGMMTPSEVYTKSDMIYKGTPVSYTHLAAITACLFFLLLGRPGPLPVRLTA